MYVIGLTLLGMVSTVIALFSKDKVKTLFFGIGFGLSALLMRKYSLIDYWNPAYSLKGLEDFMYGFEIGTIAACVPDIKQDIPAGRRVRNLFATVSLVIVTVFTGILLNVTSILHCITPPLLIALQYTRTVAELIRRTISAALTVIMTLLVYLVWNMYDSTVSTGLFYSGINQAIWIEILFAFAIGFGANTTYQYINVTEEIKHAACLILRRKNERRTQSDTAFRP